MSPRFYLIVDGFLSYYIFYLNIFGFGAPDNLFIDVAIINLCDEV